MHAGRIRPDPGAALLELYDTALPQVYGYLLARCGRRVLAEDLTAETFLAAVAACRSPGSSPQPPPEPSVGWLVGIARHKLVDHWRAAAREERGLRAVGGEESLTDPWDERLDALLAREVLDDLPGHHRAALTLRYLDGLTVPEVARTLGRTVHATEALLVRARAAFRRSYEKEDVMADPLDALRIAPASTDPDPAFAAALRARLERLLLAPEAPMTTTTYDAPATVTPGESNTITCYLAVVDARAAVEFYVGALGATRRGEPIVMPDGRVGHVEVQVGNSVLMLADEFPEMGLAAPVTRGGVSQSLHLETADPDATVDAAVALGARLERPVADGPYGRTGVVVDPDGHRWMISRSPATVRPGEVVYASLWAPDRERTLRFYTQVLGWTTEGGHAREVGLGTFAAEPTTLYCCYHVPDVDAALVLVRAAGGTTEEPVEEPWGRTAMCVDDQGLPFAVSSSDRPLPGGPGSLGYREMRVPDAVAARAFYGTVLGWRFLPGNTEGFWHPAGHEDAVVLSGGHETATVVPWFRVDDVATAVAAAREAGGTADESGAGVDDQGTAFHLVG